MLVATYEQNFTDEGLDSIALCKTLVSLNLTWCVRITDIGLKALAQHCSLLQLLRYSIGSMSVCQ
jgi:F-box/leucine-rich repeat protein 2/20